MSHIIEKSSYGKVQVAFNYELKMYCAIKTIYKKKICLEDFKRNNSLTFSLNSL